MLRGVKPKLPTCWCDLRGLDVCLGVGVMLCVRLAVSVTNWLLGNCLHASCLLDCCPAGDVCGAASR